jgi:tetratricopeptide (TPR) repeat protein
MCRVTSDVVVAGLLARRLFLNARQISPRESILRNTLRTNPNNFEASIELAHMLLNEGRCWEAVAFANNATEVRPSDPKGWDLLGTAITEMSPVAGEEHLGRAMALTPLLNQAWPLKCRLAKNLKRQGRFAEARALYQSTPIVSSPHKNGLWALREWAELEEMDGRSEDAIRLLRLMWEIDPSDSDPLVFMARIRLRDGDEILPNFLYSNRKLSAYAMSEKGKIFDTLGLYKEAWDCFEEGKRLAREATGAEYQDAEVAALFQRLRDFRWDKVQPAATAPGPQPIFVTGFMRSGTTLAEQILTSHPAIAPGGELQAINNALAFAEGGDFLAAIAEAFSGVTGLRDFYLDEARRSCRPSGPWFTDKMPLNEVYIPLIRLMFPKSPIIRMVRHPLDVMVSAFSHHATHGNNCSFRLETLALHFKRVADLTDFPGYGSFEMSYEDLVEGNTIEMFKWCGLSADDAIDHTKNTRIPLTPSHEQVKRPLYTTSIGRWKNYRRQLQPAIDILQPVIERWGYEL